MTQGAAADQPAGSHAMTLVTPEAPRPRAATGVRRCSRRRASSVGSLCVEKGLTRTRDAHAGALIRRRVLRQADRQYPGGDEPANPWLTWPLEPLGAPPPKLAHPAAPSRADHPSTSRTLPKV